MTIQTRVTIEEAQSGLARLIEQVRQGEEIVLLKDGVEIARLLPPHSSASETGDGEAGQAWRTPGALAGLITEIDPDWWKPDDEMADLFEGSDSFEGARGNWGNPTE
ncbi:type II toxin-antitoxin system Phd/YefM family antitoxin [Bosea sp. PAMC 26642]|uniref:type II toxin-antitoxin system Phd/YefM family antitoxin n=1 Tax=Bosea sp. (strain PAMC 26642) TaxID=1792307 RepID=UPI00077026E4|nr:hypothetical protein [Bosea sp. PAMC 26642]AMJ60675.1 hypothetical protein AXW83_10585 [Bosea sp. PAMC 26642]